MMLARSENCQQMSLESHEIEGRSLAVHPLLNQLEKRPLTSRRLTRVNHDTAGDTYRCFLPDLTGFVFDCCAVSNRRRD